MDNLILEAKKNVRNSFPLPWLEDSNILYTHIDPQTILVARFTLQFRTSKITYWMGTVNRTDPFMAKSHDLKFQAERSGKTPSEAMTSLQESILQKKKVLGATFNSLEFLNRMVHERPPEVCEKIFSLITDQDRIETN